MRKKKGLTKKGKRKRVEWQTEKISFTLDDSYVAIIFYSNIVSYFQMFRFTHTVQFKSST